MPTETRIVQPGRRPGTVRTTDGQILRPPAHWALLEPGDATLTRRVKQAGPHWVVQVKRGRRTFSKGVWADAQTIESCREALETQRQTEDHKKKLQASRKRRADAQDAYVIQFEQAVVAFLDFDARYEALAKAMATIITAHATPVGSQTVARTKRIPIEERANKAVIAWMRHETTAYDTMSIPRIKGARRQTRRKLAQGSVALLSAYRAGEEVDLETCPLAKAVARAQPAEPETPTT